jgi:hypothetical protein
VIGEELQEFRSAARRWLASGDIVNSRKRQKSRKKRRRKISRKVAKTPRKDKSTAD